jgi:hypothetical protein
VVRTGETKNAYKGFVGKHDGKKQREILVDGRIRLKGTLRNMACCCGLH